MPNLFIDKLMPFCPQPALRAYLSACRLARPDSRFRISHEKLARRIGPNRRASAQAAMKLLQEAGLVARVRVGGIDEAGQNRSNDYQLMPIDDVELEHAARVLQAGLPWSSRRRRTRVPGGDVPFERTSASVYSSGE